MGNQVDLGLRGEFWLETREPGTEMGGKQGCMSSNTLRPGSAGHPAPRPSLPSQSGNDEYYLLPSGGPIKS